jgi:surface polysaccharide O-acyltransferase-like enzyme
MIWGHILYRNRGKFTKKWIPAAGMGFLFVNMIRSVIQRWQYRIDGQPSCVIFWFSAMGLFCAVCVACFCLALFQGEKKESRGKRMICQIASCTFMIYLLHMAVRDFLSHMGYQDWLNAVILGRLPGKAGMVLYMMAIMGSIFGISLLLSVLLGIPGRLIKNIRK